MSVAGHHSSKQQQLEAAMDPFSANIIATSRHEDYLREADIERVARSARRDRRRHHRAETVPTPRHHEATRPAIA